MYSGQFESKITRNNGILRRGASNRTRVYATKVHQNGSRRITGLMTRTSWRDREICISSDIFRQVEGELRPPKSD